ncbi:MAG: CocE/NonD family hydrolase, partial [Chloroflexota bacterium]
VPGPCIDYLHEVVRWLDWRLKGQDTGIAQEPPIQVFMQRYDDPVADRVTTSGQWRGETAWPCAGAADRAFLLDAAGRLTEDASEGGGANAYDQYTYKPAVGLAGGLWSGGIPFGLPTDQRPDEAFSLTYTSEPLMEETAILGRPRAILHVSSSAVIMAFSANLCDVAPDGTSALVAKGILNATRRHSLSEPTPLVPGDIYQLEIEIDCTGWVFAPGHRVRLDVAGADYPNVWPTPLAGINRIYRGDDYPSRLILPIVPPTGAGIPPSFRSSPSPQHVPAPRIEEPQWQVFWDVLGRRTGLEIRRSNRQSLGAHLELENWTHTRSYVSTRDPADVGISSTHRLRRVLPDMAVEARARMHMRSTAAGFHLTIDLEVTMAGMPHFSRRWVKDVPRNLL